MTPNISPDRYISQALIREWPEIYHYTTADGLLGILKNGSIWATHMGFLNDRSERIGYFEQRFQHLLHPDFRRDLTSEQMVSYCRFLAEKVLGIAHCYTTSFCKPPPDDRNNGLLSQWRGYGTDGGYAVVFETQGIKDAMAIDNLEHAYAVFCGLPVEYFPQDGGCDQNFEFGDTNQIEQRLKERMGSVKKVQIGSFADEDYAALNILSSVYKSNGFREEQEIRIVAIPPKQTHLDNASILLKENPVQFRSRGGLLIPYLHLNLRVETGRIPIVRIIVGPHPNAAKRATSVRMLAEEYDLEVDVVISETPYIG